MNVMKVATAADNVPEGSALPLSHVYIMARRLTASRNGQKAFIPLRAMHTANTSPRARPEFVRLMQSTGSYRSRTSFRACRRRRAGNRRGRERPPQASLPALPASSRRHTFVTAVIDKAIVDETIAEMAEKRDVVVERDVRASAAATKTRFQASQKIATINLVSGVIRRSSRANGDR